MTQRTLHSDRVSPIVSSSEAAEILGVSKVQVTRLHFNGKIYGTRLGQGPLAPLMLDRASVERLAAIRRGETGDVIDRVDLHAAEGDPVEDRDAYVRDAWLTAIRIVTERTGGTFYTGQLRAHLPEDARGHAPGGLITGLVRSRRIEAINNDGTLGDPRSRHSSTPCKTYRVIGELA